MKKLIATLVVACFPTACVSYNGITRDQTGVYVVGNTLVLGLFTLPFVRRCSEDTDSRGGPTLVCQDISTTSGTPSQAPTIIAPKEHIRQSESAPTPAEEEKKEEPKRKVFQPK